MNAMKALCKLSQMGYRFKVAGEKVQYRYEGQGKPDPDQVKPLLGVIKQHKDRVRQFLAQAGDTFPFCCGCPQFLDKAVHPDFPGWCLYWQDVLQGPGNGTCRAYREGRVPKEPVCCPECGGIVFMPEPGGRNLCAACEWNYLQSIYPGLRKH